MRLSLFWKILIGFGFTFFCILEGLWVLFAIYRPPPPPRLASLPELVDTTLAAAAEAVRTGGTGDFTALRTELPELVRNRIAIGPAAGDPPSATRGFASRDVAAPDGVAYRLTYDARDVAQRRGPLDIPLDILLIGAAGGLGFSAALAWYLTRPIGRLRGGFDRLARGELGTRLGAAMGRRRDELADLARDFDAMAIRLQSLVEARDRLLHDVSHELRSPLARLHLAVGLARQAPAATGESLARIETEARRLDDLVGELLSLSRVESGGGGGPDYFDPRELLRSVIDDARFEAQVSGIAVAEAIAPPTDGAAATVVGHAELLRRSLDNIVRNALRFSATGQTVTVGLAADPAQQIYTVTVEDEGPGVPLENLERMFEPFVRGGDPGAGTGLGLAIARRAVVAAGGEIAAENRAGGGLRVSVTLPFGPVEEIEEKT